MLHVGWGFSMRETVVRAKQAQLAELSAVGLFKVYYFNGHLPVFVHEKSALATFRLFSTQLVLPAELPHCNPSGAVIHAAVDPPDPPRPRNSQHHIVRSDEEKIAVMTGPAPRLIAVFSQLQSPVVRERLFVWLPTKRLSTRSTNR